MSSLHLLIELSNLNRQQSEALQKASYDRMSESDKASYDRRRLHIAEVSELLRKPATFSASDSHQ
jgi:hypothetical protein